MRGSLAKLVSSWAILLAILEEVVAIDSTVEVVSRRSRVKRTAVDEKKNEKINARNGYYNLLLLQKQHSEVNERKLRATTFLKKGKSSITQTSQVKSENALSIHSPCSANTKSKDECLNTAGAECMYITLDGSDPLCLPCQMGAAPLPCPPIESMYGTVGKVKSCDMKCGHQYLLSKSSACTDVTEGKITKAQCMSKGASALGGAENCMWISYKDGDQIKSICGPCTIGGLGNVPCYSPGNWLSFGGANGGTGQVQDCASKCEETRTDYGIPCGGPGASQGITPCIPTPAPPEPIIVSHTDDEIKSAFHIDLEPGHPEYFAAPVLAPFDAEAYRNSARAAADMAGWYPDTKMPPDAHVVVFGAPPEGYSLPPEVKAMWGPGPPGVKDGLPAPGTGVGTIPTQPPSLVWR